MPKPRYRTPTYQDKIYQTWKNLVTARQLVYDSMELLKKFHRQYCKVFEESTFEELGNIYDSLFYPIYDMAKECIDLQANDYYITIDYKAFADCPFARYLNNGYFPLPDDLPDYHT